ncbi:hypothetical protein MRX96_020426 [Rhipicephalus microplus]
MQIILDHYACASYVVDYVNKSDRGMSNLKRIVAEILKTNPNDDIEAVIRKLHVDILKRIEMSAQEAACFLLKQDMSHKSREVVYVPTCYPEERVRVRKTRAELEALPLGSTDVWKANVVQNREIFPLQAQAAAISSAALPLLGKEKRYGTMEKFNFFPPLKEPEIAVAHFRWSDEKRSVLLGLCGVCL